MIPRLSWYDRLLEDFKVHPVCALLGPRQCGKTTLAKALGQKWEVFHYFDCENPTHLSILDNPIFAFQDLRGLIIIDEVQRRPEIFPILRCIVDENPDKRFLLTGSASRDLISQSSETLAGRIGYHALTPLSLQEYKEWPSLWHRGGFPKSLLAETDALSMRWRQSYIQTFIERDLAMLDPKVSFLIAGKLWKMLAHSHGSVIHYAALASSLGIDQRTVKRYVGILQGAFMITLLPPWHANAKKREVKSPKVYIRDSGIFHALLNQDNIRQHPAAGASFEGFVIEELQRCLPSTSLHFWSLHSGAEMDVFFVHEGKRIGCEIKLSDHPKVTASMHRAIEILDLDHVYIIHPHTHSAALTPKISLLSLNDLTSQWP